jgi:hypothetical protein
VRDLCVTMAMAVMGMSLLALMVVLVTAQAPSPAPATPEPSPAITCALPNSSMVSSNFCNALDQQSMSVQTQDCDAFLTDVDPAPSTACCQGLNEVAYNRTACICMITFYPPSTHNASRQLALPSLCSVQTNLCSQCPAFLISRSNGTAAAPICKPPLAQAQFECAGSISIQFTFLFFGSSCLANPTCTINECTQLTYLSEGNGIQLSVNIYKS